jgi:hypothetical protein
LEESGISEVLKIEKEAFCPMGKKPLSIVIEVSSNL